ncbi:MAG: beta-L-arabinofuranosidase domain-containing protein [Ginsengibacter sp.]
MKLVIIFSLKKISSRNKIILIVSLFFTLLNSYAQVTNERRIVIRPAVKYKLKPVSAVNFSGYLGNKLDAVINNNIMMEDVEALIEPFRHRTETSLWQTEFWGKWMLSAAKAYEYNHDSALLAKMKTSVEEIISTQSDDGYIGNYAPGKHLQAWDIWGRKYTLSGLLYYYDIICDKHVLVSAKKLADHLLSEVGPGKASIVLFRKLYFLNIKSRQLLII